MLLLYPPVARSCEAPIGIARLAAYLHSQGTAATCLDLNQEGQQWLLDQEVDATDTWTKGAQKRRAGNMALLRSESGYQDFDRYARAVRDLSRSMAAAVDSRSLPGLADYQDQLLSPLRLADLCASASTPEGNPFFPFFSRRLAEGVEGLGADGRRLVIGLSIIFLSQALPAFAIIGHIRREFPKASILVGGGLVTSWLSLGLVAPGETFGGLVDALLPGRGEDSIAPWLDRKNYLPKIERAVCPDYSDFAGLAYLAPGPIIPYSFSSGCPWKKCSFCPEKAEDSIYVGTRVGEAMKDLSLLGRECRPRLFHFTDNEISPLYLNALAKHPPGPPWYGFARFTPLLTDPAYCASLAASGCLMLQLGLESGDQTVLDALGKGTRIDSIRAALACLRAAGIRVYLYVLFGTPPESKASALITRDFMEEEADRISWLNLAIFNMPVSAPDASLYSTRAFYEGDLSLYCEFSHPDGWNRGQVRRFIREDLESRDGIRAIMRRTPPIFTSSHAAFFPLPN